MNEALEKVHALVDGELTPAEREAVSAMIAADENLGREYAWAQTVKDLVRTKCTDTVESADWAAARARIREVERVSTINQLVSKYAWSICGVLVVGVLAAGYMNQRGKRSHVPAESLSTVFQSPLQLPGMVTDRAAQNHTGGMTGPVRPFGDDLRLFARDGRTLVRGFSGLYDGHVAAEIQMVDADGPLFVYAIKDVTDLDGVNQTLAYTDMKYGLVRGQACVSFTQAGALVVVTGDRSLDRLVEAARSIR